MLIAGYFALLSYLLSTFIHDTLGKPSCLELYEAGEFKQRVPLYRRAARVHRSLHTEASQQVKNLYSQELSLPEIVLERSVSNWGDTARLRKFFEKLLAGEPVSVVIVGGSITCGGDTRVREEQWSYRVYMWIKNTYPHEDHTYHNLCKSASPSMVTGACLGNDLPEKIDIIFIEYTVNDNDWHYNGGITHLPVFENEWRRGFERLLRKLSNLPKQPAMVYLHVYQPAYMGNFWKSAEVELETILQYYSIPTVSARNALYHLLIAEVHGFSEEDVHCDAHPNPLGHRYYADLVIATLQDHAYATLILADDHMGATPLFGIFKQVPPPMLEENYDFESECLTGERLREALLPDVTQEWRFVDEGKPGRPKWGFLTTSPDTSIVLQINTTSPHKNFKGDILLALGYLVSYEHMGSFSVECVLGCQCEGVRNQTATHTSHSSVYKFIYFDASQHNECKLKISSLKYTVSGGHKVKFDTLMVATGVSAKWVEQMNRVSGR